MINKINPSRSDVHSLNPQSSILNPLQDLKEIEQLVTHSIQHRTKNSMRRVIVIGSPGAGKTVLARRLASLLGLPLIHLDQHSRLKNWTFLDRTTWRQKVMAFCAQDQWIIDGDYLNTLEMRAEKADTILFLDLPHWLCTWRVFFRGIKNIGRVRPDMPRSCRDGLNFNFLKFVLNTWRYKKERRPEVLAILRQMEQNKKIITLRNKNEIQNFWSTLNRNMAVKA